MKTNKKVIENRIKWISKQLGITLAWKTRDGVYGPYIHALIIPDKEKIGCYDYFNGGTGTYYTLKEFDAYIEGLFHICRRMLDALPKWIVEGK